MVAGTLDGEAGLAPQDMAVATKPGVMEKGMASTPISAMSDSSLDDDAEAEKRLVRKMDLTVFPILFVVYMLSFLDRINISNARIQGMTQDLDLTGNRFNIALFVRFTYCIRFVLSGEPLLTHVSFHSGLLCPVHPA